MTLLVIPVLGLGMLTFTPVSGYAVEPEPPSLLTLQALQHLHQDTDRQAAAESLVATYGLDLIQADALLALPVDQLEQLDDQRLRRLAAALKPTDDASRVRLAGKRLSAGAGATLPIATEQPVQGNLHGGVSFTLERLQASGDRLAFELQTVGGQQILNYARLLPIDIQEWATAALTVYTVASFRDDVEPSDYSRILLAEFNERVTIDTRLTAFASCNFRGLIQPISCVVQRIDASELEVGSVDLQVIRWSVQLADPDPFEGLVRGSDGRWSPLQASAVRVEAIITAKMVDGVLVNPQLSTCDFYGDDDRLAVLTTQQQDQMVTSRSRSIRVYFDALGGLSAVELGQDAEVVGRPLADFAASAR